jgi:CubicO group peptidase (beta-lactamase class C family)
MTLALVFASLSIYPSPEDELSVAVRRYMKERDIPGMSMSVTYDGQLVYAKGFGLRDKSTGASFTPETPCRIGSISKGLTAIGIAKLLEEKRLKLEDKILPLIDSQVAKEAESVDPRWCQISVRDCLLFKSGNEKDCYQQDVIAKSLGIPYPPRGKSILRWRIKRPLDTTPGTRYHYNGFHHYLLARVIESVSGKSYFGFMKNIFSGVGAPSFTHSEGDPKLLGSTEARYYSKADPQVPMRSSDGKPLDYSYWYDPQSEDGAGAWVASSVDVAKVMWAYGSGRIVGLPTLKVMFGIDPKGDSLHWATGKGPNGEVQVFNGVGAVLYGAHAFAEWKKHLAVAFVANSGQSRPGQPDNKVGDLTILDLEATATRLFEQKR